MINTFPTPSDIISGLRLMYADAYDSGPHESLFSLLLHPNGQLAAVGCLTAHASDETLRNFAMDANNRAKATSSVLLAVCNEPVQVLSRAASFYRPSPRMLIGVDSLQSGSWHEYTSGEYGHVERSAVHAALRFLAHWEFCSFSETFTHNRWGHSKPTKFKAVEPPLERFLRSVASGRAVSDHSRTGGLLVYSEQSRDEAIRAIDLHPANALDIFSSAARELSGEARIEALVAAGIAAFFASKRPIAEHAYLVAVGESADHTLRFDERLMSALGALVTERVNASSATELVQLYPPTSLDGALSKHSA